MRVEKITATIVGGRERGYLGKLDCQYGPRDFQINSSPLDLPALTMGQRLECIVLETEDDGSGFASRRWLYGVRLPKEQGGNIYFEMDPKLHTRFFPVDVIQSVKSLLHN